MGGIPAATTGGYKHYWDDLVKLVIRFIDRGIYVTLCPLQHNPSAGNTDITYRGNSFEAEHFADFWGKFATAINNSVAGGLPPDPDHPKGFPPDATRPNKLAFDLINEPHVSGGGNDKGITVVKWMACARSAIEAIRNNSNMNTIFIEGMGYASVHLEPHLIPNPASSSPAYLWQAIGDIVGLVQNVAISAHCYDGIRILPSSGTAVEKPFDALRTACKPLLDWARAQGGRKVHIGEVAVDAGIPAGCSDRPHAQDKWDDWNNFCREYDDVLVGWNWWANTSKTWGWPDEGSCKDPSHTPEEEGSRNWALTQDDGVTSTVYADVIKASIPV